MTNALTAYTSTTVAQVEARGPDWGQAAGDWLKNLSSGRTRDAYLAAWRDFTAFAGKSPDQVTQSDVIDYKVHLKTVVSPVTGRTLGQSTVNQRLSALSSFYRFAAERGLVEKNPVDGVGRESVSPYGKATWLDPEEEEDLRFLAVIPSTTTQGRRDRAIMLLFLTQALRVEEVARLTVGSLRRQGPATFLTYRRKGGETEEVPLADLTAGAIDAYLADRGDLAAAAPLFVATSKGRRLAAVLGRYADEDKPLDARAIRYLVKTYCDRAFGKGHGLHPHSLRHTAAQVALHEGRTVTEVSRLLKHRSLAVTTIYLHSTSKTDKKTAQVMNRRYATA